MLGWALLGVQSHTTDLGAQDRWFRLESHDARAVLSHAAEGVVFTDVERRLGYYLRALWGRNITLRSITNKAAQEAAAERPRRVAIVGDEIHMPPALDVFPGQHGAESFRSAARSARSVRADCVGRAQGRAEHSSRRPLRIGQIAVLAAVYFAAL